MFMILSCLLWRQKIPQVKKFVKLLLVGIFHQNWENFRDYITPSKYLSAISATTCNSNT